MSIIWIPHILWWDYMRKMWGLIERIQPIVFKENIEDVIWTSKGREKL
jgi:hypothetical protein